MALDASIPLKAQSLDTATPLLKYYQLKTDKEDRAKKNELTDVQIANEKFKSYGERDKARIQSTILGAAELHNYLEANDPKGAESYLNNRRLELGKRIAAGEPVDTAETDDALNMLKTDPEGLKNLTGQTIKFGQLTGILKTPTELGGKTSATDQVIGNLRAEDPKLSYAQALQKYQTGYRSGTQLDENGEITALPGFNQNLSDKERAKKQGSDQGEIITKAQSDLPKITDTANTTKKYVEDALNHKGLGANFGLRGQVPNVPGGDAANAASKLDQLKDVAFLNSYESLRGSGAITDVEGAKGTNAIFRMQKSQSEEEFKNAAKDFLEVIDLGVKRAENRASGKVFNQENQSQQPTQSQNQPVISGKINYDDPKVREALDNGYTAEQIMQHLGGKK